MQQLMQQAQAMQRKLQESQEKMKNTIFEGKAGGGSVKVQLNGTHKMVKIDIKEGMLDKDNKDMKYYLVAEHTDLNDKEQTFMISPVPKTGDDTPVNILFGLLLLSGLGLAYIVLKKRNMVSK